MTRIEKIRNYLLPNDLHLQFFVALMQLIKKFNPTTLKIVALFELLCVCIEKEDLCYKIVRKSDLSRLKAEKDHLRDDVVAGIKDHLKSCLRHFDIAVCEAAYRLMVVFNNSNKPISLIHLPYDAETIAINKMLQEFWSKHAADVKITGLTEWLEELRIRNDAFNQLAIAYNEQQSEKPLFQPKDARKETDEAYKNIVYVINALIIMEGEEAYATFVIELNTLIKHYNNLLAQHLGRVHAEKEREKAKKEQEEKEQKEKEQGTENKEQGSDENKN
jgi:hypothetical protein